MCLFLSGGCSLSPREQKTESTLETHTRAQYVSVHPDAITCLLGLWSLGLFSSFKWMQLLFLKLVYFYKPFYFELIWSISYLSTWSGEDAAKIIHLLWPGWRLSFITSGLSTHVVCLQLVRRALCHRVWVNLDSLVRERSPCLEKHLPKQQTSVSPHKSSAF